MLRTTLLALAAGTCVLAVATASQAAVIYGVTTDNTLFSFSSATPTMLESGVPISGLANNEKIRGIDVRPATGQLYAVGSFGNIYTLNGATGAATLKSTISGVSLSGTDFGVDFNPVPDRLRITTNTGQNLRINVDTGVAIIDGTLSYASGATPNIAGSAYTNSNISATPPAGTTLYDIDSGLDQLVIQNPPNNGTLVPVGGLGINTSALVGFDIETIGTTNTLYASLTPFNGSVSNFYTIDLTSGAASLVGQIDGGILVTDIAVVGNPSLILPEPATLGAVAIGALGLVRRRKMI